MEPRWIRNRPEAVAMDITPEIAKELLETSTGNRALRGTYIATLAGAMRRGEWRVTNQGIGIDIQGALRDGHHRLSALIEANLTLPFIVTMGMPMNAYEVIDTGAKRTMADLLTEHPNIAEIVRLAANIINYSKQPTVDQVRPILESKIGLAARRLLEYCNTSKKYFSSASMKLAAIVNIINSGEETYIREQYRALVLQDYDAMSSCSKALARQVFNEKVSASDRGETLARAIKVFDPTRRELTKIQISQSDKDAAIAFIRSVITHTLEDK